MTATRLPDDWICPMGRTWARRCSPIALPVPKTSPPRDALHRGWRPVVLRCCGLISPAWAIRAGNSPTPRFSSNVRDLVLAADALAAKGMAVDLVIGHSLGGAAVLKAAQDIASSKAVVTIGAPFDPGHVTHNFGGALDEVAQTGSAMVSLAGRPFEIRQEFVEDVSATQLAPAIASLHKALLVMHGPLDDTVDIDNAAQIFGVAKHPKSFVTLDQADHLVTRAADAEYAADVIAAWATRYLDLPDLAKPIGAPEGVVRVAEADPTGFLQDVNHGANIHTLADEPLAYGGTNRGLTPYGFVAAGLGACTSMTIRMYARRKGWPLDHVSVDVTHDKVHAQDAEPGQTTKIDTFTRAITLDGKLSDDQRKRLLEIADKCPVHRTLEAQNHVVTHLVDR